MAKYHFQCDSCSTTVERYASVNTEVLSCKECSSPMKRLFPTIGSKKVTETVDSYLGIRQEEDIKKTLTDRRVEYFWEVEVPRLVQTYSTQTCLEEGWLVYNEKGEMVIGKPKKITK